MGKKRGIGHILAEQTRRRATVHAFLASRRDPSAFTSGDNASAQPWIIFGVNISCVRNLPQLGPYLAEGFRNWAGTVALNTRQVNLRYLDMGLVAYLKGIDRTDISLQEIDRTFLTSFVAWLDRPDARGDKPWEPATRNSCLKALRAVLNGLTNSSEVGGLANEIASDIPFNPWPGLYRRSKPRPRLATGQLQEILVAAEREIQATMTMWQDGQRLLTEGRKRLGKISDTRKSYANLALCLAALDRAFPAVIPNYVDIRAINSKLAYAVVYTHHTTAVTKYLYPTARLLAPFVVFFTILGALNAVSACTLKWSQIQRDAMFGVPIIRIWDEKGRAASASAIVISGAGLDDRPGAIAVLDFLENWTNRLRSVTSPDYHDRVFMFVQETGEKFPKSFGQRGNAVVDITWGYALQAFCRDNQLPKFTLAQIRPTVLDEMQQVAGDVVAAQRFGRHVTSDTTWHHYTSDGTRRRYQERLGEVFELKTRWWQTQGTIDPRLRTAVQSLGSATPGFYCFDPYDSPQPNQRSGTLCSAYGRCPICPLSAARVSNYVDVALYQELRRVVVRSQTLMTPKTWLRRWAPVVKSIDVLLTKVPPNILARAGEIRVDLPPID